MRSCLQKILLLGLSGTALALPAFQPAPIDPTYANVSYGSHPRQVLDLYRPAGAGITPLAVFIHGGSWKTGDKSDLHRERYELGRFLEAGISVAAVNYRFTSRETPLPAPLMDAARAVQFLRSRASEWKLDRSRVAAFGSSAGGCTTLWLAFHDDLADPAGQDPVQRESTRLRAAAVMGAQTSVFPDDVLAWIGPLIRQHRMIPDAFGLGSIEASYEAGYRETYVQASPITHVSSGDPPVFLIYPLDDVPARDPGHAIHHPQFGLKLKEKADRVGVSCRLRIAEQDDGSQPVFRSVADFLISHLAAPARQASGLDRDRSHPRNAP